MATFVGIALELESVAQIALATVRVRFTQDPLQANPAGVNDALNPANWTLSGPGVAAITGCGTVFGDPQSIDLFLAGPLAAGTWTVTASTAIQTATASPIQPPRSLSFDVTNIGSIEDINAGFNNDDDANLIRKHLNQALKGEGWNALIAAIATGERTNRINRQLAFNQLTIAKASGLYLEREAADNGIEKPINIGMSDDTFRDYVLRLTNNKLTEESLLKILQVFYGDSSLRANASSITEPYFLQDGDDLNILIDEEVVTPVVFNTQDFAIIGQAKAVEVAAAITRSFRTVGSNAYAAPVIDPQTGLYTVVLYSSALGLSSSIRVTGGKAQNVLQFPDLLDIYTGGGSPTWNITVDAARGVARFTSTSTSIDLTKLQEGDYVNIYGNEFNADNRGSFTVTAVSVTYPGGTLTQYFEIINLKAVTQAGLAQIAHSSLLYFRPTKKTIHATADRAVIVSVPGDEVDISLPATSQAVSRQENSGAYGQVRDSIIVSSLLRQNNTVTATAPLHGLSVDDWIYIDGAIGTLGLPTITTGNGTTTTSYSLASVASVITPSAGTQSRRFPSVATFNDGMLYVAGGFINVAPNGNAEALAIASTTVFPTGTQYTFNKPIQSATYTNAAFCGAIRTNHPATFNKILVFGGTDMAGSEDNTSKLATNGGIGGATTTAFGVIAPMAVELNNQSIMAFGGVVGGVGATAMQIYDPPTNSWTNPATPMTTGRLQGAVAHVGSGSSERVWVFGGRTLTSGLLNYTGTGDMGPILNTIESYNPNTTTWTAYAGKMTYARFGHQVFVLDDNRMLIIGGWGYNPTQSTTPVRLATCEILDNTGNVLPINPMRNGRAFFAAGRFGNKLYVAGGTPNSTDVEVLDLQTLKWSLSNAKLNVAVDKTAGVMLGNVLVVVEGEVSGSVDDNYRIISIANETLWSGGLNGLFKVNSVPDINTFNYLTDNSGYTLSASCVCTPVGAIAGEFQGPFSYDLEDGVAVTGTESTITMDLSAGLQYNAVTVADASQFPDAEGWLAFDFGYENQVDPVRYFGRLSNTELSLDYSFKFPKTVLSGSTVTLLYQKGPWTPANPQDVGSFYLTDSPAGRIAAEGAIDLAVAAGVTINKTIVYPGDRGLGNEGFPANSNYKVSDKVSIWGSSDVDADLEKAREE